MYLDNGVCQESQGHMEDRFAAMEEHRHARCQQAHVRPNGRGHHAAQR